MTAGKSWTNGEAQRALTLYEPIVRAMARRLWPAARLGQGLDDEDLVAEGRIAVLEALGNYEGFGIEERTWVRTRVRQRMIDAIRRLDLRSRDEVRSQVSAIDGETDERTRVASARRLVSFDSAPPDHEPLAARLFDTELPAADELADRGAQRLRLLGALSQLPPRQRKAIELALFDGMPLRAIGEVMGISESRVCQLQKRAVRQLKRTLSSDLSLDAA